jgi:hypothetical protein
MALLRCPLSVWKRAATRTPAQVLTTSPQTATPPGTHMAVMWRGVVSSVSLSSSLQLLRLLQRQCICVLSLFQVKVGSSQAPCILELDTTGCCFCRYCYCLQCFQGLQASCSATLCATQGLKHVSGLQQEVRSTSRLCYLSSRCV